MKAWVEYYGNGANRLVVQRDGELTTQFWLKNTFEAADRALERAALQEIADAINRGSK